MSQVANARRRAQLVAVATAAAVLSAAAVVTAILDARAVWRPEVSGPVLPDWSRAVASAQEIEIVGESRATLVRADGVWQMPSRDGYPVRPESLAALDAYLASLVFEGARTANPDRLGRLGLAAPGDAQGGTLIAVRDQAGDTLAEIILGDARDTLVYVRQPDRSRAYAARSGDRAAPAVDLLPADAWLDLDFLALGASDIARVDIQPETGPAYRLVRAATTSRNFALRQPAGWQPITAAAGNGPATTLGRLRFRDVRAADRLGGSFVAHHTADTFAGLRVRIDVKALGETRWALITASALTDDAEGQAIALNARTEGWAYLMSDLTIDRLIRPLERIADPGTEAVDAP
ncbi:DUF4340 domain-containing protein [Maricaulis maris]|jgi:hypothetical protein|uniref:DUF4340 domain-containing protein n=1 Tax=Maricaulis maris TaxID=74318 RepID=UPI0026ECC7FF|nr:DUF4340 domain-containing protein [Maricaulis maris]